MVTRQYIVLLILLVIIFFNKQLFFGEVFYCCDNLAINVPSKVFLIEEVRRGIFPLWNPYILSGSPFLADINLGLLYPLNALFFLFPPFRALTAGIVLDFVIAGIGAYVFARSLKVSQFGATISSVIFAFSGTMVTYTNNVPMLQVASLLPWIMWVWIQFFTNPTKRLYLILVFLLTLQIIAGHPQLTYYTWLLGIGYLLFVSPISWKKRIVLLFFVGGLTLLLSGVQVIPFIELVRHSTRLGRGFGYASFDSLHPLNIFRFIVPRLIGNLSQGTDWLQGGSVYGYIGVLPIILALWIPLKNIQVRFFLVAAATSLILALGKYTPLFFIAYKLVPGLGSFRSPGHFLLLYTFSIAILAGFGIDEAMRKHKRNVFTNALFIVGCIFIASGLWWIDWGIYPLMIIAKFRLLAPAVRGEIIFLVAENLLLSGILLFCAQFANKHAILFFVVFLELFLFSRDGLVSVKEQKMTAWLHSGNETAKRMTEPDYEQYRIFVSPRLYSNPVKKQFGVPYVEKEAAWQIAILRTNINMLYHLPTIDGYASLIYRSYAELFHKKELFQKGEGDPTGIEFGNMTTIPWNSLGVRYILASPRESVFINNSTFTPIWSDRNRILYRNPDALPVASVAYHPKSVIIGFWLTVVGVIVYSNLFMSARERKKWREH